MYTILTHVRVCVRVPTQASDPQVITGSHDSTVRLWDLRTGKTLSTLTFHKKSVRAMVLHPEQHAFASASADNIKKFALPNGDFLHNMLSQQHAIVNTMAVNSDGVMVTGVWRHACTHTHTLTDLYRLQTAGVTSSSSCALKRAR